MDSCAILINPNSSTADYVELTFSQLKLNDVELVVYDGIDVNSPVIWTCSFCTNLKPPPLRATSGSVLLYSESTPQSTRDSQMKIQYMVVGDDLIDDQYIIEVLTSMGTITAPGATRPASDFAKPH